MVCNRCILVVEQKMEKIGVKHTSISLGEIVIDGEIPKQKLTELGGNLSALGFEVLDNNRQQLIEQIKNIIIHKMHYSTDEARYNFSEILSKSLHKDYSYLSGLFSEVEGTTIEKYIIKQKVERVKELIICDELSLSEIAHKLGYSSVAHLSNQFKKVTGLTPSYFKQVGQGKRKPLDKV